MISRIKRLMSRYGFGPGKKVSCGSLEIARLNTKKLHLGCGNTYIRGWCNVDVLATGCTDLVDDITILSCIANNSVEEIYACHVLEHFPTELIPIILKRWHEVLKPGGVIHISVPDLDAITAVYQRNLEHFHTRGNQPWIALIYGGQKDEYDFHKTGFNYTYLSYLMELCGFTAIQRYPHVPHFIPGVIDNSLASAPFGEYISLNIVGYKPPVD